MVFSDFTSFDIGDKLGITVAYGALFPNIAPVPLPVALREWLDNCAPLALLNNNEKCRSELLIAPVLVHIYNTAPEKPSYFSGVEFDVDPARGLRGFCDYMLSLSTNRLAPDAPVVLVVEAKNDNIMGAVPQCIAEMFAASIFNDNRGKPIDVIYGVISTGLNWNFLRLWDSEVLLDLRQYDLQDAPTIFGNPVSDAQSAGIGASRRGGGVMTFSDFTFDALSKKFGLKFDFRTRFIHTIAPATPGPMSAEWLKRHYSLASSIPNERARAELLITPMLLEARNQSPNPISYFPGFEFNVDPANGLCGYCDYILSASDNQMEIIAPVLMIVEAKLDNLAAASPQCAAAMYAARLFNTREGFAPEYVYGVVSTGIQWGFLRLHGNTVDVDPDYPLIDDAPRILGILLEMLKVPVAAPAIAEVA